MGERTDAAEHEVSEVCVVQISDCHLTREVQHPHGSADVMFRRAVEMVAADEPDVLLLTGDIADDGSAAAYRRVEAMIADVLDPTVTVMATPGNHDLPDVLNSILPTSTECIVGGWRILTVDSSIPGQEHGRINVGELIDRLDTGDARGAPTVLALHHPPIPTSTHPWFQLDGAPELIAALSKRTDVRVVVSGHLHEAFVSVVGSVSYIGCSSSLYAIKHHGDQAFRDDGHVGALAIRLRSDGTWSWNRLPDPLAGRRSLV
jgi:3',5'-cyclic-AMP phosphodiesterase